MELIQILSRNNPNEIRAVIGSYPESVLHLDSNANLPIHIAVASNLSFEVIEILATASPKTLTVCNVEGLTPLDIVVCYCCCPQSGNQRLVDLFLHLNDECMTHLDEFGRNSFHRMLEFNQISNHSEYNKILKSLCERPTAVSELSVMDKNDKYPLMSLLLSDRHISSIVPTVGWMISMFPSLLAHDSPKHKLPLHIVLKKLLTLASPVDEMNNIWTPILNEITSQMPNCRVMPNAEGVLPCLSCARWKKYQLAREMGVPDRVPYIAFDDCSDLIRDTQCPDDILLRFVLAFMRGGTVKPKEDVELLTHAIQFARNAEVVRVIIQASSNDHLLNPKGCSPPLITAIARSCHESVLQVLISAWPGSLLHANSDGDSPLVAILQGPYSDGFIVWCINTCPACAQVLDKEKELPLHKAILSNRSAVVIQALLAAHPDALKVADREKDLPLHRALEGAAVADDLLIKMVSMNPEACAKKNRRGDLPLHDALYSGKSIGVIEAIADVYPDAVIMKDKDGVDPIHLVLDSTQQRYSKQQQAYIVLVFIRLNWKSAKAHDRDGLCPLHLIVQDRGYDQLFLTENVLKLCSECAKIRNRAGDLPIHVAVLRCAPVHIITALIVAYPDSLTVHDKDGDVPLHYAVRNRNPTEQIVLLVDSCPSAAGLQDKEKELPIHYALRDSQPSVVIHKLLDAHPEGLRVADRLHDLPLHRGLEATGTTLEVLTRMISMYSAACQRKNRYGDLPLHDAIFTGKPIEVIDALANAYSDAITTKDKEGQDPIHIVLASNQSRYSKQHQAHIVALFIRLNSRAASCQDREEGMCPLHLIVKDRGFDAFQLTETVVASYPECASVRNREGDLPIHFAVVRSTPAAALAALIAAFPDGLMSKDRFGDVPLHYAVRARISTDSILQILDGNPAAAGLQDKEKELPIHYATRFGLDCIVLHRLLDAYPNGLGIADREKDLPLHRALEGLPNSPANEEVLIRMVNMYPAACHKKNRNGDLPLHDALYAGKPYAIVEAIAKVHPDAAVTKDKEGQDPIHIVMDYSSKYSYQLRARIVGLFLRLSVWTAHAHDRNGLCALHLIVQDRNYDPFHLSEEILAAHPECATIRNRDGDLPIHFAVQNNAPVTALSALIHAYPDGLTTKDKQGDVPLHYAVRNKSNSPYTTEVVLNLLKKSWTAAGMHDKEHNLPIHYALRSVLDPQVIYGLLEAFPDGLRQADKQSDLPLHIAVESGNSDEVILRIISLYALATQKKNRSGDLPLHDALIRGASIAVVETLIDVYPEAATVKDREGTDPIHILLAQSNGSNADGKQRQAQLILLFVKMNAHTVTSHDRDGQCPLHLIVRDRGFDQWQLAENILALHPDTAARATRSGDLPIHYAVAYGAPKPVVAALIKANPDGLLAKDKNGDVPLHYAVRNMSNTTEASNGVLQLIDGCPAAAGVHDKEHELPIHYALRNSNTPIQVIRRLLDANPASLQVANREKDLPLHVALEGARGNSADYDEIILRIVTMSPDGCKHKNRQGHLALHDALMSAKSIAVIDAIVNANPDAIVVKDREGNDPIHIVLENAAEYPKQQQAHIVELFIRNNMNVASAHNRSSGVCALHIIVQDRGFDPFQLTEHVLAFHPECAKFKTRHGDLPLHYAVKCRAPPALGGALITAFPDGLKTKDKDGDLPLHYAVQSNLPMEGVLQLINGYPAGVGVSSNGGRVPAIDLVRQPQYHTLIYQLVRDQVIAADIVDGKKHTLIKAALENPNSLPPVEFIGALVATNAQTVTVVSSEDGQCAFPVLNQFWDLYVDVIIDLLSRLPANSVTVSGKDGETGLHKLMKPALPYNNPNRMKVLSKWLELPCAATVLHQKDASHHTPISYLILNSTGAVSNAEVMKTVLRVCPAAVHHTVGERHTSLLELALQCHPTIFGELLANGADLFAHSRRIYIEAQNAAGPNRVLSSFKHELGLYMRTGGCMKSWKKHNFKILLLSASCFFYRNPTDTAPHECIGLRGATIQQRPEVAPTAFELVCRSNGKGYLVKAETIQEMNSAIAAFNASINGTVTTSDATCV
jgi:ankyrin repeat protein